MPGRIEAREQPLLVDAVFGEPRRSRASLRVLAFISAIALHVGLFFLAQLSGPSLETWSARVAAMVHHDLSAHAPTSIETLPPPPPAAAEPPPPPAAAPAAPTAPPRVSTKPPPAAPARAAKIVAAENTNGPVDLTDNTFVTGTASAYAGGATTKQGTSDHAVSRGDIDSPPATEAQPSTSAAQPVSLTGGQWHCPWPTAALAQDLYEQAVIVRALVQADGTVERASVVSDPGYGFGAAAVACTLRTRLNPARNARGEALRALSPPIRVRFTR